MDLRNDVAICRRLSLGFYLWHFIETCMHILHHVMAYDLVSRDNDLVSSDKLD